jgi:hypothetical protein
MMARLDTVRRMAVLPDLCGTYGKAGRVGNMPGTAHRRYRHGRTGM